MSDHIPPTDGLNAEGSVLPPAPFRGSRRHVLEWTDRASFPQDLLDLVKPIHCRLRPDSVWKPRGTQNPQEAKLERFGPLAYPGHPAWDQITRWWLASSGGANTPNWDIALSCDVEGRPGLILVEAKANVRELGTGRKPMPSSPSPGSIANHGRIGQAIEQARLALDAQFSGAAISRDKHYQLSNRLAFAWRLASLGIPTVLVYLGFTGDEGIRDAGDPLSSDSHWGKLFQTHLEAVCPKEVLDGPISCGSAKFWLLVRSRPALSDSPPPVPRKPMQLPAR